VSDISESIICPDVAVNLGKKFVVPVPVTVPWGALEIAVVTKAVVATLVVLSPADCVTAVVVVFIVPFNSPEKVVAVAVPVTLTPVAEVLNFTELSYLNSTYWSSIHLTAQAPLPSNKPKPDVAWPSAYKYPWVELSPSFTTIPPAPVLA